MKIASREGFKEMNQLQMVRMDLEAEVLQNVQLPGFLGNVLRGCLGRALLRQNCGMGSPDCETCSRRGGCVYPNVFKVIRSTTAFPTMPAPFVIRAPEFGKRQWQAGEALKFSILLFGSAIRWSTEILQAASTIFEGRFAQTQGALRLQAVHDGFTGQSAENELQIAVWSDTGAQSIPPVQGVKIRFLSPTQVFQDHFVVEKPEFSLFMDSLFARIAAMVDIYGEEEFVLPYGLVGRKPQVAARVSTQRITIPQDRGQRVDGIIGEIVYEGNVTRYLPYLDLGTQLHIGKKTTRGCGQYEIEIF